MYLKLLSAAALATSIASGASAATIIVDTTTNAPLAGKFYTTFDNRTLGGTTQMTGTGITVSFTGNAGFVQGASNNAYSPPVITGGNGAMFGQANGTDTTTYVSSGSGTFTMAFAVPSTYLGFLWGSVDSYNSLTIFTADGLSQVITGGQLINSGVADKSSIYVNFTSSSPITGISGSTGAPAFEIDNVALSGAVPEPATWAMMLVGFGLAGFAMRRRQQVRVSYAA